MNIGGDIEKWPPRPHPFSIQAIPFVLQPEADGVREAGSLRDFLPLLNNEAPFRTTQDEPLPNPLHQTDWPDLFASEPPFDGIVYPTTRFVQLTIRSDAAIFRTKILEHLIGNLKVSKAGPQRQIRSECSVKIATAGANEVEIFTNLLHRFHLVFGMA